MGPGARPCVREETRRLHIDPFVFTPPARATPVSHTWELDDAAGRERVPDVGQSGTPPDQAGGSRGGSTPPRKKQKTTARPCGGGDVSPTHDGIGRVRGPRSYSGWGTSE